MEIKWIAIAMALAAVAGFAAEGYKAHVKAECVKSYVSSSRPVEEINQLCGVK